MSGLQRCAGRWPQRNRSSKGRKQQDRRQKGESRKQKAKGKIFRVPAFLLFAFLRALVPLFDRLFAFPLGAHVWKQDHVSN